MSYTLQDCHNYAKYIPHFFKGLTLNETFQEYEIRDILDENGVPENTNVVAAVWIWTRRAENPSIGRRCFVNSHGHRVKHGPIPTEIGECLDKWLADVRTRKEEFEAFMKGVATNYTPLSLSELHQMRLPR